MPERRCRGSDEDECPVAQQLVQAALPQAQVRGALRGQRVRAVRGPVGDRDAGDHADGLVGDGPERGQRPGGEAPDRPLERGAGHGEADQRAAGAEHARADRVPFGLVAVEERFRVGRLLPDHRGELPGEVGGVLEPGVHALATGGRVDVRGVPGEEDPAGAVGRHLAFVAVEAGDPAGVVHAVVAAEGAAGDLAHLVQLDRVAVGGLVRVTPAHHAVPAVTEGRDEGEGVAHAAHRQDIARLLGQPDVGQSHRPDHGSAGEGEAERMPHGAAHSVGADEVAGGEVGPAAVRLAQFGGDGSRRGVLPEPGQLRVVPEADAGGAGPVLQHALHLVLRGDQHEGEAGAQPGEVERELAEEAQGGERGARSDQLVGQAAAVEQFERAGVYGEGARHVARPVRAALHERDGDALGREIPREQQAGGARAHDEDVDGLGCGARGGGHVCLLGPFICCLLPAACCLSSGARRLLSALDGSPLSPLCHHAPSHVIACQRMLVNACWQR